MNHDYPFEATRRLLVWGVLCLLAGWLIGSARADTFTVTVASDNGQDPSITTVCAELGNTAQCSLRAAITIGNNRPGAHIINILPSVGKITVINGSLPTMNAPFVLNGNHVTIDGNGHGCISLADSGTAALGHSSGATGSTVANLVIGNCSGDGISANGHGYIFTGNFIGVDATGLNAMPNTGHGISVSASHVYPDTSSNFLLNTYNSLPIQPVDSSTINSFSNNLATALTSLVPIVITGNVISGNKRNGIEIFSQNLAAVLVNNNMIGTDLTGNSAIANGENGIRLIGSTFGNLIGPNNIISGNTGNGIAVQSGTVFLPNFIMGNRIGLAASNSSAHIGNGMSGIYVDTKPDTNPSSFNPSGMSVLIGPGNVISDNKGANNNNFPDSLGSDSAGIIITGASTAVKVVGNTIGMAEFPAGTASASTSFGNAGDGIIITTSGNTIGGTAASSRNIIAGNARHGIVVSGSSTTANSILGNAIGVHPAFSGNLGLGNGVDGIHISGASSTTIGGSGSNDVNVIAGNGRNGVKIRNGNATNGWSNLLQRNLIYGNASKTAGIGIDLNYQENAADTLHGEIPANYANLDQAPPQICKTGDSGVCAGALSPISVGGTTTVNWTMASHGPANFRIEFFTIDAASVNSATSMTYVTELLLSTDGSGAPTGSGCSGGRCTTTISASPGKYLVMTATDITVLTNQPGGGSDWKSNLKCFIGNLGIVLSSCNVNNTSEFSGVVTISAPTAPSVSSSAATSITTTTATLNGTAAANGASTTVTFEYGTTSSYGGTGSPLKAAQGTLASGASSTVSAALTGLTCNTLYHFRVVGSNSAGTSNGSDLTFTTAPCTASAPTVTTTTASNITTTTATLNGKVSANGATTTVTFQYGTSTTYTITPLNAAESPLSSGASAATVSAVVNGLTCGTTYFYRVNANNNVGGGTVNGSDVSFTTSACAVAGAAKVTTTAATNITATTATLNGTVSSSKASTVTFDYGLTAAYGSTVTAAQSPLAANLNTLPVSANLTGLSCETTYHFRANADNGTPANGSDLTFTTGACSSGVKSVWNTGVGFLVLMKDANSNTGLAIGLTPNLSNLLLWVGTASGNNYNLASLTNPADTLAGTVNGSNLSGSVSLGGANANYNASQLAAYVGSSADGVWQRSANSFLLYSTVAIGGSPAVLLIDLSVLPNGTFAFDVLLGTTNGGVLNASSLASPGKTASMSISGNSASGSLSSGPFTATQIIKAAQ